MQISNGDQNIRSNTLKWYLFAEYALSEIMPDNDNEDVFTAGFLFQSFRELGVPPEWIGKIKMTLTGFVKEALAPFQPGRFERSGCIRVYCQNKMIDDTNSVKTSRPDNIEQTMEHEPITDHSGTIINEGWGYFIIKRSGGPGSSEGSHPLIDLYLYKEGK